MNYIREINAFIDWLETNPLDAITQTLWFHLMAIANKCGWPEWFAVANLTLQAKVGVDKKTLIKHRNLLIQKGLIEYKNQGKLAGRYKLIPISEKIGGNFPQKEKPKDDMSGNIPPIQKPIREPIWEPIREPIREPLYKLNETKQKDMDTANAVSPPGGGDGDSAPTNQQLIAELVDHYRKTVPEQKHQKGDYAFIGRLYNEYGYDCVLEAIQNLGYRIDSGFIPDKPLIYLKAMLSKSKQQPSSTATKKVPRAFASLMEWASKEE